jgi:lipopolysaccharide/colanic/teichoic acid biosynthesis glycosyltransferase
MSTAFEALAPHDAVVRRGHETPPETRRQIVDARNFRRLLDHERARSDRSGHPFAVVAFDERDDSLEGEELTPLVPLIERRIRCIDELGLLPGRRLAVLLPYTGEESGWKFVDDILQSLPLNAAPPVSEVYVYPSRWLSTDDDDASPGRPMRSLEPMFARPLPLWKRLIDVLGAVVGLLLSAPLFLAVALALKIWSPGPVFFSQLRSGLGGRPFRMFKFRTMVCDAERRRAELLSMNEQDGPAFKVTNDPRVTPLGRWLRITHIDELPQLWNVLKGEMSLVGPRPLPCAEAAAAEVWQRRRHDVTPGLTCLWQARGRARNSFADWMRLDLKYVQTRSLYTDLKLLLLTIPTVLRNRTDR